MVTFGKQVEGEMDEAAEGAKTSKDSARKRQMVLSRYMKNADGSVAPGAFKDPAAR